MIIQSILTTRMLLNIRKEAQRTIYVEPESSAIRAFETGPLTTLEVVRVPDDDSQFENNVE
jgi:hypothetical protein